MVKIQSELSHVLVRAYERARASGWGSMRLGVQLLFWGLLLSVLAVAIKVTLQMRLGTSHSPASDLVLVLLATVSAVRIFAIVLGLTGACLCCTIPRQACARRWAWGFLACLFGIALMVVVLLVVVLDSYHDDLKHIDVQETWVTLVMATVAGILFAAMLCLTMVLRAAARFWADSSLGRLFASYFVAWWLVLVVSGFLIDAESSVDLPYLLEGRVPANLTGLTVGVALGFLIYTAITFVLYLTALSRLYALLPVLRTSKSA
jgi:hypothetical protein